MGGLNHCCYFHCSWSLNRKRVGVSKRVIEYSNPVMTVFTHGAGFLPWSLTFPLTHEGFPSALAGIGRVCYRKCWRQIILGSWRRCLWDTDEKEEAKAGQEARAGCLQCCREKQIMPQVLLGSRVTLLLYVPVWIVGPAISRSEEPKSTASVNHFKALFVRQRVSILLRL